MVESDIRRNIATNHEEGHHGAIMPGEHSGGDEQHIPEISHEEEHDQEEHEQAERNIAVKNNISPTIIGLVLALMFIATIGAGNTIQAANINNRIADYNISARLSIDNAVRIDILRIDAIEAKTIEINAMPDSITTNAINDGIYAGINDNIIKNRIPVDGIDNIIVTNILNDNSTTIAIEKEDIAY